MEQRTARPVPRGSGIETIRFQRMEITLLASGGGTESIRHVLQPGARGGLHPEERWQTLAAAGVVAWAAPAVAEGCGGYQPDADVVLDFNTGISHALWDATPARLAWVRATFPAQDQVHETACGGSGMTVGHWYVWVRVDGYEIVAIDPPRLYFNGGK